MRKPKLPWTAGCSGDMSGKRAAAVIRLLLDEMEKEVGNKLVYVRVRLVEIFPRKSRKGASEKNNA